MDSSLQQQLADAVVHRNLDAIITLYTRGVDGNLNDGDGNNLLHMAVRVSLSRIKIKCILIIFMDR